MRTQRYPSDLTDEQWALVKPLIPVWPGGRPRKTSMRDVVDAIFYLVRTAEKGTRIKSGREAGPAV
jgi:putative transposase